MDNNLSLTAVYNNPAFPEFGKPCDSNLKTQDGTEFEVYSEPLSIKSEFFRALFSFDKTFGQSSVIHGISSDILEIILVYLYTGYISLNAKNVMQFLKASDFLLVESLKTECKNFLIENKTYRNCVGLFLTGYRLKEVDLECRCRRFLLLCFEKAVKFSKKKARALPYESLVQFLSNKTINVSGERFVWSFIEAWVQKDPFNRMPKVPELLRCLSVNEMDERLASDILSSPIIQENELYKASKDQISQYSGESKRSQVLAHCSGVPFITGFRMPPRLYFVIKRIPHHWGSDMFISYDENLDVWRKVGRTSKPRKILRIDHRVYMFKSNTKGDVLKRGATIYDLLSGTTSRMAPIPNPVPFLFFYVEAAGHIYALKRLNGGIVNRYVEDADRWVTVAPMHPMIITDAVGLNGQIYVIGSIMEERMVMQIYDPYFNTWYMASSPSVLRDFASAAVYQGRIFLVGGISDDHGGGMLDGRTDVEVYDPMFDEWLVYPDLPFPHSSFCMELAVVKDRLYVFKKRLKEKLRPLGAYWDGSGRWKVEEEGEASVLDMCVCSIEDEGLVREIVKKNKAVCTSRWKESGMQETMPLKSCDEVVYEISR